MEKKPVKRRSVDDSDMEIEEKIGISKSKKSKKNIPKNYEKTKKN